MKEVWILNHYAVPPTFNSGTRHYDLAEQLVKRGYMVSIFASSFDHKLRKETLKWWHLFRIQEFNGVRFVWVRTIPYRKNDILRILNMASYVLVTTILGSFMRRPDALIASSFHPFTWICGWVLSSIKRALFIAEVRDLWPQTAIDMGSMREDSQRAKLLRRLERFIYKRATWIVVLFPGVVDYMREKDVPEEKIVVIPNGLRIESINHPDVSLERQVSSNDVNAIYVGAHGFANALHVILKAAKILQEWKLGGIRFSFYGDGPEKSRLMRLSQELQLTNVAFHPAIPKKDVPDVLSKADVGLVSLLDIPLYRYGMSLNKLFDYMGSGLPVVFAGHVSNDIVRESGGGVSVPPEDPQALAEAIVKMSRLDAVERRSMGDKGRQYVIENHNMEKLADKLESLLR